MLSLLAAPTVSHAIYVQVKVLKAESRSSDAEAKADVLSRFSDMACLFFGIAGAVQFGVAMIGLSLLRNLRSRQNNQMPNHGLNRTGEPLRGSAAGQAIR